MSETILVVEDEPMIAEVMCDYLLDQNFQCHIITNGLEVEPWVKANKPDIILLDLMLPGKDGIEICKSIRTFSDIPIIILTARVQEIDRLVGLDIGADDYVCKPYSPKEVVARVKAIFRRMKMGQIHETDFELELDERRNFLIAGDEYEILTTVECHLLKSLINGNGKILSREQLMKGMYLDGRVVSDRTIDSHVKKLRQKISKLLPDKDIIFSVYGVGYRIDWQQ